MQERDRGRERQRDRDRKFGMGGWGGGEERERERERERESLRHERNKSTVNKKLLTHTQIDSPCSHQSGGKCVNLHERQKEPCIISG